MSPNNIPAAALEEFDADWYQAAYPDVVLSGLSPRDHFVKFGLIMGRAGNARQRDARAAATPAAPGHRPLASVAAQFGNGGPLTDLSLPAGESPIISTPADLSASPPRLDLGRPPAGEALCLMAGAVEIARLSGADEVGRLAAPLVAYCRLLGLDPADGMVLRASPRTGAAPDPELWSATPPALGGAELRGGATRIANAWYTDEFGLRVMLTGAGTDENAATAVRPDALRIFQADAATPGVLQLVGGQPLSGTQLDLCDAVLLNPLMPVLLELSDKVGLTLDLCLLPFPSLLRGGLHAAERAALQLGPEPMQEIWRLSAALLAELCPPMDGGAAPLSVTAIEVDPAGATGAERIFSRAVRDWLGAVFGLTVGPAEGAVLDDPGERYAMESLRAPVAAPRPARQSVARGDADGLVLTVPAAAVPTLGALASRRLALPGGQAVAGPFLVADSVSCRPQWSVALPWIESARVRSGSMPVLRPARPGAGRVAGQSPESWLAPLHLSIRYAPPIRVGDIRTLQPEAPDAPDAAPDATPAVLSLALKVSDPALTGRFLNSLVRQSGVVVDEILLCLPEGLSPDAALKAAAGTVPSARLATLLGPAGPDRIAEQLGGAGLLLAEDSVILYDPHTVAGLAAILAADPQAASASCVLLHEAEQKGRTRIQVASAGLFPGQVSFTAAPRLGVVELDCLAALPQATYPVLANTFRLCLLRRAAIAATRTARAEVPGGAAEDVKFGLDALAAGYRNLCTSTVRAGTTTPPTRRDEIDPFGLAAVLPARWDDLLASVTVLRELRG